MFRLLLLLSALAGALRSSDSYGKIPLSFAPAVAPGAFSARGHGYSFALTAQHSELRLPGGTVRMALSGARPGARLEPQNPLPGVMNWFVGPDPAQWRRGVPTYARLRAASVLPGVDLVYYGQQDQLEYDLIVAPGADPDQIRWQFSEVNGLRLAADGALLLATAAGELLWRAPEVYQEKAGRRVSVPSAYQLQPHHRVGFTIGDYDRSLPLIIDPTFDYVRNLGQPGRAQAIQVDQFGQAYIAGYTPGATPGSEDAFVAKLDSNGARLIFFTTFGGPGNDRALGLALDREPIPNLYLTGSSASPNGTDAFFYKVEGAAGFQMGPLTTIGGSGHDSGTAIAMHPTDGTVYIAGTTDSTDLTMVKALQPVKGAGQDGFLLRLHPAFGQVTYSTYLGGSGADTIAALQVDAGGRVWLAGTSTSREVFAAPATHQPQNAGGSDCLVTGLNFDATARVFSSYLGGAAADGCTGLSLTPGGNIVVTGYTDSSNFPTLAATQAAHGGARDMFVAEFGPVAGLLFSTFFGGPRLDTAHGITVDASGTIHLAGESTGFLPLLNAVAPEKAGSPAVLVRSATSTGALNQVIGGLGDETAITAIAYASATSVFAAGNSGRLYRSLDGGVTWVALAAPPAGGIQSLAISGTAMLAATPHGVFLSLDQGASWASISRGLPADLKGATVRINASSGAFYLAHPTAGFFRSANNGVSWASANSGLTSLSTLHLATDPASESVLYLATPSGVFRSTGGGTWALAAGPRVLTHVAPAAETGVLYGVENGQPVASADAGNNWTARPLSIGDAVVRLAVDPGNARHLLAATAATGIWRSLDAGLNWALASPADATATDAAFAPGGNGGVLGALRLHPDAVIARWGRLQAANNRYSYYAASATYFGSHQADAGLAVTADANTINTYVTGYSGGGPFVTRFGPSPGACAFHLSGFDPSALNPAAGGAASAQMAVPSGCSWTAATGAPWLQLHGGGNRTGSGEVRVFSMRNGNAANRETTLTLAGTAIPVRQNGTACETEAKLSSDASSLFSIGATLEPRLDIPAGCEWTAATSAPWILLSPTKGVGTSTVRVVVSPNPDLLARNATVHIGPANFVVSQAGTCEVRVRPDNIVLSALGGSGTFAVETQSPCPWSLTPSHPFLRFPAGGSGTGPGSVSYIVDPNPSAAPRSAVINGLLAPGIVMQDGNACTYSVSPNPVLAPKEAKTLRVFVTTQPDCRRPARSDQPWLAIAGAFERGSGGLQFTLAKNPLLADRTARVEIGGQTFLVVQSGQPSPVPTIADPSPASGSGVTRIFTIDVNDEDGDLDVVNILINSGLDARAACYLAYVRSTNTLYLVPDSGEGLLAGNLTNSQCSVDTRYSSLNGHSTGAVLGLLLNFSPSFTGNKILYLAARDKAGHNTGWLPKGVWNVPSNAVTASSAPQVVSLSPGRTSNPLTTLELTVSDPDGVADLNVLNLLVNNGLDARDACYLAYVYPTNTLHLVPDSGEGLFPAGIAENRQCRILPPGATATTENGRLKLRVPLEFKSSLVPHRIVYGAVRDAKGSNSGWQAVGTITVP